MPDFETHVIGTGADLRRLRDLEKMVLVSDGLKCPNCNDEGFTPLQVADDEWEQEQCEFCYTVMHSVFRRRIERGG